jgi:hypothetical protein
MAEVHAVRVPAFAAVSGRAVCCGMIAWGDLRPTLVRAAMSHGNIVPGGIHLDGSIIALPARPRVFPAERSVTGSSGPATGPSRHSG